jgi:methionyl-tRNA formyltransferase
MLKQSALGAIKCPVLNYHAGVTPKYRGINGGYWALANNDAENFGSTVHRVDRGVDTGEIYYQVKAAPESGDSLMTYSYRLAAVSREICIKAVDDALNGSLRPVRTELPSKQWFHPTLWSYLWTGIFRKVW